MKFLEKIRYPKFFLLLLTFIGAYFLFMGRSNPAIAHVIFSAGYFGTFVSGMMFAYGFTAALGTAMLLMLAKSQNLLLAAAIGGLGSLLADTLIFRFIRISFRDEIERFDNERLVKRIRKEIPGKMLKYVTLIFAGLIIASPLPDEMAVSLLALSSDISQKLFSVLSFLLNSAGILVVLIIGRAIAA
ncbi:MAG: hypothetical protein NTZ02_01125 [Candidatus Woesearchaeota archaeon]|nr:hypothetical protein [Candidatus Woesearchaeota archaeon]